MMKFNRYIQEEYVVNAVSNQYGHGSREIFENPSKKELADLVRNEQGNYCRFCVNFKTQKLYVWPSDLIHEEAATKLHKIGLIPSREIYNSSFLKTCFMGIGKIIGGKIEYDQAYEGGNDEILSYASWLRDSKIDDRWLKPWFSGSLLASIRSELGVNFKFNEEYMISLRYRDAPYSIYKNPTPSDIKELAKEMREDGFSDLKVRFIIDTKQKNIYVWDSTKSIHYNIHQYLERHDNLGEITVEDEGVVSGNKIDVGNFGTYIRNRAPVFDWVKKYFTGI